MENSEEDDIRLSVVKNSRSISDLCTGANLSIYRADRQLICDTCDEVSNAAVRKAGVFSMTLIMKRWILLKEICPGDSET